MYNYQVLTGDNNIAVKITEGGEVVSTLSINPFNGAVFKDEAEALEVAKGIYPNDVIELDALKQEMATKIDQVRDEVIVKNFKYKHSDGEYYPVSFELEDQLNISGIVVASLANSDLVVNFKYKTIEGKTPDECVLKLTSTEIKELGSQAQRYKEAVIFKSIELKKQILDAQTEEELFNLDITPELFSDTISSLYNS